MIIKLPLKINAAKQYAIPKPFGMNLNEYRNLHYRSLNCAKVNYTEIVRAIVLTEHGLNYPIFSKVNLEYTLYRKDKRLCDVSNVCSVVDKFACDALVKLGILPEDNYNHVIEVNYKWGGIIKDEESHVILEIIEVL